MLRPKVFAEILSQTNTGGVMSSMLLNTEGSLLAYSGSDVHKDKMITAAVSSNIWSAYEKGGKMAFHNEGLQYMFMDCQEGKVAVTKVSAALICIYAEENVGFGLLKLKLDTLAEHLQEPLSASMNQ